MTESRSRRWASFRRPSALEEVVDRLPRDRRSAWEQWTPEEVAKAKADLAVTKVDVDQSGTEWSVLFGLGALTVAASSALVALYGGVDALDDGWSGIAMVILLFILGSLLALEAGIRLHVHHRSVRDYKLLTYCITRRTELDAAAYRADPPGDRQQQSDQE